LDTTSHSILITGGSSGLGLACVQRMAAGGAGVVIADVNPPRPDASIDEARVLYMRTDVTSEVDVQSAIDAGIARFGPLRGAVCCAGILHAERLVGRDGPASLVPFRRVIEVNLIGSFNVARLAALAMSKSAPDADGERGVIVMTASVAAFDGQIGQASYAASKGAVASLTLPLARELAQHAIRVVSIAPGVFETAMMQAAPEKVRQSLLDQTPYPRRTANGAEVGSACRAGPSSTRRPVLAPRSIP
jgi:NAD(P)-dependent dehydrogenase (short-subunit alcohol dehydrogenase family)